MNQLMASTDLENAAAIAGQAGFAVSKQDWMLYLQQSDEELMASELEDVVGGLPPQPLPPKQAFMRPLIRTLRLLQRF